MLNPDMMIVARDMGERFAHFLEQDLSEAQMAQIRERNLEEGPGSGICHSHDFCDANMVMDEAFQACVGFGVVEGDTPSEEPDWPLRTHLWGEAWDYAKALWL